VLGVYDGEEDVTRTLAPYMMALDALPNDEMPFDTVQEELFLAQQVYEEAKHTDLFSRYFEEVFGTQETAPYREGGYQDRGTARTTSTTLRTTCWRRSTAAIAPNSSTHSARPT